LAGWVSGASEAGDGSEGGGEGFEGIGDDGGAEFFGIGDGVEGIAEAVGDGTEAEIEGGVVTEEGGELSFELPDSAVLGEDEGGMTGRGLELP
jgi:hypothetical protein